MQGGVTRPAGELNKALKLKRDFQSYLYVPQVAGKVGESEY